MIPTIEREPTQKPWTLLLGFCLICSLEYNRVQHDDNMRLVEVNRVLKEENDRFRANSRGFTKLLDDILDIWK